MKYGPARSLATQPIGYDQRKLTTAEQIVAKLTSLLVPDKFNVIPRTFPADAASSTCQKEQS